MLRFLLLSIVTCGLFHHVGGAVAPNHFIGTCLTEDWVASMEKSLGVSRTDRNDKGQLKHPFLQPARKHALNTITDPRMSVAGVYGTCMDRYTTVAYGIGAVVDKPTGYVLDPGTINGTLVVELSGWATHSLTSLVFSILAQEILGVPISFFGASSYAIFERLGSENAGACTPTHVNMEVWRQVATVPAGVYSAGDIGYSGRSGLYTTKDFVSSLMNETLHPKPVYPDFWKGYRFDEDIITSVPESSLRNNSKFFPPATTSCPDGVLGCLNHCSRTAACTEREKNGGECMVVAMIHYDYDRSYLQATMANLGIPTYFCFLGYAGVQQFALDSYQQKRPVLFYHYEPDPFHINNPDVFERVFLPRATPEKISVFTGTFGENGYGGPTNNPLAVDFPTTTILKRAATVLQDEELLSSFLSKFSVPELSLNALLRLYHTSSLDATVEDPVFDAACTWIKTNYAVWSPYLDRQPLCDLDTHVKYDVTGCDNNETESYRTITFTWITANPDHASESYNCDGGLRQLPSPLRTSRSCEWITANPTTWKTWITTKPKCDSTFYKYNITSCDKKAKRTVNYWWLLPDPEDLDQSLECDGGDGLPADVRIDCDFMPLNSPGFVVILVVDLILIGLLVLAIGFIVRHRNQPIIKRSQWEFLILVIVGGIIICAAAVLYAGEPSRFHCGARPVLTAMGFTTVFGALFVKSLRVYRIFMKSAFKRATVSAVLMLKVFLILVAVDVLILLVWFIVDFPEPTIEWVQSQDFRGTVDRVSCHSNSFIFSALLMFWKSIVLFMGLYASFLIRNVSSDFQESIWMFASSVMVLVSCLVVLPLAYLVDMPAAVFYVFLACTLLICTALVMAFMILPKIHRLNADASSHSSVPSRKVGDMSKQPDRRSKYTATTGKSSTNDATHAEHGHDQEDNHTDNDAHTDNDHDHHETSTAT